MAAAGPLGELAELLEQTQATKVDGALLRQKLEPARAVLTGTDPCEASTLQRLVSSLCSWLRGQEGAVDEPLTHAMVQVLALALGRDKTADGIAVQKGMFSTMHGLLERHSANAGLMRSCLEVLATLSVVENADSIVSRLGTVTLIVGLLQQHRSDPAMLEDAVTTLALMAKRTRHRRTLSQGGSITVLVEVLKRGAGTPSVVVAVCRFLSNFAVKEECCMAVLENGGVDALMAAFDTTVQNQRQQQPGGKSPAEAAADTRAAVAAALWTCSMECTEVQNTLLLSGWLSSLAAVLQANPGHAGLHEAALGIVRSLSKNRQYRDDILNLGFVEEAIRAMRDFGNNVMVVKEGCGFLGNLATDAEIRVQLGEVGVCQGVVAALAACQQHDDRKAAKLALGALSNLASCEQNRDLLSQTDVVPILLHVSRTFMRNENILEYAINALSHLAVHAACNKQLLSAGAIEALLLFLGDHREDLQVVSKCAVALRRILRTAVAADGGRGAGAVLEQVAGAGSAQGTRGIFLLVEAMQEHTYDGTVVKEVALLLTTLSGVSSNVPALMQAAAKPCMKALEVHQNEASVSDALAGLLASLPLEEDEHWAADDGASSAGASSASGRHVEPSALPAC